MPSYPPLRIVACPDVAPVANERALRIRAAMLGIPYLRLPRPLPDVCWRLLPYNLAVAFRAIPLGGSREAVTVASDTLWSERDRRRLRLALGQPIFPVLTSHSEIDWALERWPHEYPLREG